VLRKLRPQICVLALERRGLPARVCQLARHFLEDDPEPLRTLGFSERLGGALYQRISMGF